MGTNELEIRTCPEPSCDVLDTATLGAKVEITGETANGYVPVRYREIAGVVPAVFVSADPANPPYLVSGSPGCDRVALIFNIGVGADPATGILDTLLAADVPATMFVMGWWAEQDPPVLERMVQEGYLIGSHGYAANELPTLTDGDVLRDLDLAEAAVMEATGSPPAPYFTPYAAAIDARVRHLVADQGYLSVAWEVPAADYGADATEESVYARVMDNIYDGAIVELHLDGPASAQSTGRALPRLIDDLRARGYQFVTIPELLEPC
ncbi:MAG: polysaccharide deacetylase family protein [Chloroflexota bacterium]|nr:polysaccharide deacetylase family protein [Chloroflexota bacterium]